MPRESDFRVGQRVRDKRDGATGTLIEMRRHSNGSPKWLVEFDANQKMAQGAGRFWTWEVDLRKAEEAVNATR